jgi:phosphoribosylformylglycinamidine cyclo-ligase
VSAGCRENGCALLGGETAEMPGVYTPPDYDLAGFITGVVSENDVLGPPRVRAGDVLVALPSTGLHTNGYSLARRVLSDRMRVGPHDRFPGMERSVADVMLAVHASYLRALEPVLTRVHAMAHITGGGLPGNLDRALPDTLDAVVETSSWEIPHVFAELQRAGSVPRDDMFRTFNMGVGMVVICDSGTVSEVLGSAAQQRVNGWVLGEIRPGTGRVVLT